MLFHQPHNSLSNHNFNTATYSDAIFDFHFHKNFELIYIIKGTVNCTINNVHYTMNAGDFGLCLPYDIHKYVPEPDTTYWVLVFSEDFVYSFSKQTAGKAGDGFIFSPAKPVVEYVKSQLINNNNHTIFTLKSCLYALCEEYLKSVKLIPKNKNNTEMIIRLIDYISENHTKKITLADIARVFGYDYNYMSRYIKNVFNMTFTDFINIYRLETALDLLISTDNSVTSIAFESGFQSLRSFHSFFKKSMNTSPTIYRKTFQKQIV